MTPKELAAAIRKGHTMIRESRMDFYEPNCGCALGAAMAGAGITNDVFKAGRGEAYFGDGIKPHRYISALLSIPYELAREISTKHVIGVSRLAIADWLDTLPDETPIPAKIERESDSDYAARMVSQITQIQEMPCLPAEVDAGKE